jgi:hypothetical protein
MLRMWLVADVPVSQRPIFLGLVDTGCGRVFVAEVGHKFLYLIYMCGFDGLHIRDGGFGLDELVCTKMSK